MTGAQEATLATLSALAIDASLRAADSPAPWNVPATSWTAEQIAAVVNPSEASVRHVRAVLGTLRAEGYVTVSSGGRWRPTVTGLRAVLR